MKKTIALVLGFLSFTSSGWAQSAPSLQAESAPAFERGWVDVNIGLAAMAQRDNGTELTGGSARFESGYQFTRGADFDFGGGVMLVATFGVGISVSGTAHVNTGSAYARLPSLLGVMDDDEVETDELTRGEGVIHLQAMFVAPISEKVHVRLFGGPSFFRVTQDMIADIEVVRTASRITITDVPLQEAEATAWGFHVGGDVSVFFNRIVGLGGFVRFSRATVELPDIGETLDWTAGGLQTGGGLRLKF